MIKCKISFAPRKLACWLLVPSHVTAFYFTYICIDLPVSREYACIHIHDPGHATTTCNNATLKVARCKLQVQRSPTVKPRPLAPITKSPAETALAHWTVAQNPPSGNRCRPSMRQSGSASMCIATPTTSASGAAVVASLATLLLLRAAKRSATRRAKALVALQAAARPLSCQQF